MFISKKKHEAALALMAKANVDQESRIAIENERGNHYRDLYLEAQAELTRWRQYGQMRDPKTGRLIPKSAVA